MKSPCFPLITLCLLLAGATSANAQKTSVLVLMLRPDVSEATLQELPTGYLAKETARLTSVDGPRLAVFVGVPQGKPMKLWLNRGKGPRSLRDSITATTLPWEGPRGISSSAGTKSLSNQEHASITC